MAKKVIIATVVGMVSFTVGHRLEYGGRCLVVDEMIVDEERRRLGVGSQLLEAAELAAIENDCATVVVPTEVSRRESDAFYKKAGYTPIDVVRLVKKLQ